MDGSQRRWRIGELAAASGLSVRALRHYDERGLLVPAERTSSGYRLYSAAEMQRLYRITALRRLGLGLEAIAAALDGDTADLASVIRRQREAVVRELAECAALRDRLDALCAELDRGGEPAAEELITTMEAMQMYERYYTGEQLQRLEQRGQALGQERIAEAQREWEELFSALREARAAGVAPEDPSLDRVRTHARELLSLFTGGDPDLAVSLGRMWNAEDPETMSRGALDRELAGYMREVFTAGDGVGG